MPEVSTHAPGSFCWIDLGTTDPAAAKRFYAELLGWEYRENPMPEGGAYTMIRREGRDIGGLYELSPEMREQGVPPNWLSYIAVESADASSERAERAGAEVVMGPMDVMDVGRMAVIQDPTGAVFAVWQAKAHSGCGVVGEPGSVCWNELMTKDAAAAKKFYSDVFGYEMEDQQMGPTAYTMLRMGERREGGLMQIAPEMGPVPSHWMVYIAVSDIEGTIEKTKQLGGKAITDAMDVPGVGRFAVLQDPQGAVFSAIRLS
ncbi:MAG TPA: VOC family protein [bacterium]|nr:VOC family protein [bacterium]